MARPVSAELRRRGHWVRGLDVRIAEGVDEAVAGDIAEAETVQRAMRGVDAVVHLAAHPYQTGDFMDDLLGPNVVGLHRVLMAAADGYDAGGVRKLTLASTMQVVSGVPRDRVPRTSEMAAPTNHYALTKRWAEVYGEMVSRTRGLPVLAVRIGWLTRNSEEAAHLRERRAFAHFLSHDDAGRFFADAVEADATDWKGSVVYAVSRPPPGEPEAVDRDAARRLTGYEARDVFPQGLPFDV